MVDPEICVGIDVGCRFHRVGIAGSDGTILGEFDILHTQEGSQDFFYRIEHHHQALKLPVTVAVEVSMDTLAHWTS